MIDRRTFIQDATATAAALALPPYVRTQQPDLASIYAQIGRRHDEAVQRLQEWIRQPSIAAENRGMNEGCELTMRMLRDAGFQQVTKMPGCPSSSRPSTPGRDAPSASTTCTTSSKWIRRRG